MKKKINKLKNEIKEQDKTICELSDGLNETREKVQALLDFCFTDKTNWLEGQTKKKSQTT